MTEIVERLRATTSPLCHNAAAELEQQAASLAAKDAIIDRIARVDNSLAKQLRTSIENNAALKARAEQAERALTKTQAHLAMRNSDYDEARRALAEAVEVMRPFGALSQRYDDTVSDEWVPWFEFITDHAWPSETECKSARAFVAQHGSDSKGDHPAQEPTCK